MSDWAETRAAELLAGGWPPEGGSVSWLRYRSNIAAALREAEARGRASMKEEAAKHGPDSYPGGEELALLGFYLVV